MTHIHVQTPKDRWQLNEKAEEMKEEEEKKRKEKEKKEKEGEKKEEEEKGKKDNGEEVVDVNDIKVLRIKSIILLQL